MTRSTELPIAAIRVGTRYRKDLGDIGVLADSIRDGPGLLHPVVVTPDDSEFVATNKDR